MSKEEYRDFVKNNEDKVSIFLNPRYFENFISPDEWDVVVSKKRENYNGILVFQTSSKLGMTEVLNLPFIPNINPQIFSNENVKRINRAKEERQILSTLFDQLSNFSSIRLKLSYSVNDCRPLIWNGYTESSKYSSVIDKNRKWDEFFKSIKGDLRTQYRKFESTCSILLNDDFETAYANIASTFIEKKIKVPIKKSNFLKLCKSINDQEMKLMSAVTHGDKPQNIGSIFCILDKGTIYYMMGGFKRSKEFSGSQTFLILSMIKYALENDLHFDFEGSMINSIDNFFMGFDPDIVKYSFVTKTNNKLLKLYRNLKGK